MLAKEFIQALRNPRMRIVLFLPPLIQLMIFGYAANTDIRHIPLALYDLDAFRRFVLESAFAQKYTLAPAAAARLRQDDEGLLNLGYIYVRQLLGLDHGDIRAFLQDLTAGHTSP